MKDSSKGCMLQGTMATGTSRIGLLGSRLPTARSKMSPCGICPRECAADRQGGEAGECGMGPTLVVSAVSLHTGEEPPLNGPAGACNVFLTGCSLHCSFCQNHPISHLDVGRPETPAGLARRVMEVVGMGARVINFVTGSHQVPAVMEGLAHILRQAPDLVVAWNSSGYEKVETLRLLDGIVDVYLPDFKFWDAEASGRLCDAPDYPAVARAAISEMSRQVGPLVVGPDGVAERGLIIRHLVLPGGLAGTSGVLGHIARDLPRGTAVSLMGQYVPAGRAMDDPVLGRRLEPGEYEEAVEELGRLGLETGWIQEIDQ